MNTNKRRCIAINLRSSVFICGSIFKYTWASGKPNITAWNPKINFNKASLPQKFHIIPQTDNRLKAPGALIKSYLPTLHAVRAVSKAVILETETKHLAQSIPRFGISERLYPTTSYVKGVGVLPHNRFGDHISCVREYFNHLISGHCVWHFVLW